MSAGIEQRSIMSRHREAGAAIVVTGAAGGIGGGIVERLLADGWRVIATDLSASALERLKDGAGDAALSLAALDVADSAAVDALAGDLKARGVAVAGLVNAAGLLQDVTPFMAMDEAAHRRIWDVNYFGALACTRAFGAAIMAGGGGAIVNIGSTASLGGVAGMPAYTAAKHGLLGLTRAAALDYADRGIRINAVCPGSFRTAMSERLFGDALDTSMVATTPMGRLGGLDEIAAAVLFLLSDAASFVTGAALPVEGGKRAR